MLYNQLLSVQRFGLNYQRNLSARVFRQFSTSFITEQAKVTQKAPDFEETACVGNEFKTIRLSDYKGKWLYLFFYPLDFTFACPTEIVAFDKSQDSFKKLNCEIVGASIDSKFSHLAWNNTPRKEGGLGGITIPLISDLSKKVSSDYGALLEGAGHTARASYLIDPQGVVRQITINDPPVGRSVDEAMRLLKAYQFADEHGEVCPANWQEGEKTIKASPTESKEFFKDFQ